MELLISFTIPFIDIIKRRAPRIEPWGTLAFTFYHDELSYYILTRWYLSVR